jgi:bifunctional DNA-binding transcriptional regulator/antitoxin component of YhaV-PrlF toxin-antitoxin module
MFKCFWLFFVVFGLRVLLLEEFVVRVFAGGKVTVPKQLRVRFGVGDGDYVRLALVEVLKRGDARGEWVRRRVE